MKLIQKRVEGCFKNKMKSTRALQDKGGKAAVVLGYSSIGWGSRFAP
jgi:hypothetical protein